MANMPSPAGRRPHDLGAASRWVRCHAPSLPAGGVILDVAAGAGRHSRLLLERGHAVVAVDRDVDALRRLRHPALRVVQADLEAAGWPFAPARFAGVVVTNYLWRPLLPVLAAALAPGGVLIYETFMAGNERFGKPSRPDFLLQPDELRQALSPPLSVLAFEQGETREPRPAMVQRLCARRPAAPGSVNPP